MGEAKTVSRGEIQQWLLARLSSIVGVPVGEIDARAPFSRYGLDSFGAVDLVAALAEWLDRELAPTLLWDCPSVAQLSEHLAGPEAPEAEPSGALNGDTEPSPPPRDEPIAIVGIGCRFPGAPDPDSYWRLLCEGANAIREVPADRWDWKAFTSPDAAAPGKMTTNLGGFLERVDEFDHRFFGISPREAARMDPQQRLLLEVAWEALEDAGIPPERLAGSKTGVFVGVLTSDYADMALASPRHIDAYSGTGSLACVAANRISYALDLTGPSMAIDTACSSSLVAVHAACESIRRGECEAALAGGVNVIVLPTHALVMTKAGALSPDGRCYSFDARANGYVRGEGSGVVVLKALSKALADGDPIYAVIRGSAVNHGGRSNGLTAPRQGAQEELLREAYRAAGVSPGDVTYVEAHGTGTPLGDPIELKALGAVLAEGRAKGSVCSVGSVKTNIGHLEAAAGVAGLIKVALALKHGEIPASLNFERPNPHIPFDSLPLRVQAQRGPWPRGKGAARVAGVSSFGLGGTNAHVVLEEAPAEVTTPPKGKGERETARGALGNAAALAGAAHIIPLSAHSPEALRELAAACRTSFSSLASLSLADISHTAGLRRQHHDARAALVVRSREELLDALSAVARDESRPTVVRASLPQAAVGAAKKPVFVFSGQGPQWFAMGRGLMQTEPAFREVMEACDALVREHGGFSLLEELRADEQSSRVHESEVVQPALFAIQIGLAALWRSYGVEPGAVLGHSGGEIAAAYVSGVLELEDAVRLAVRRGKIMARAIGRTAAVALSAEEAQKEIKRTGGRVSIAAVNSPTATTLSGDAEPLDALIDSLERRGIFARALRVKCAAHSHLLEGAKEELRAAIADLSPRPPRVPIVSTLTGEMAGPGDYTPAYWARQMREPVLFAKAVGTLVDKGYGSTFIEMNPHPVLAGSIAECLGWRGEKPFVIASLRRGEDDRATFLAAVGSLYAAGHSIEWGASLRVFEAERPEGFQRVRFPLYPWQRERSWLEPEVLAALRSGERGLNVASGHPLLGRHICSAGASGLMLWELDVDRSTLSYIDDHKVQEALVFQSLTYVEMVLAAAREALGEGPFAVSNIAFRRALFVPESGRRTIRLEVLPSAEGGATFSIYSRPASEPSAAFTLHVTGSLTPDPETNETGAAAMSAEARGEILGRCQEIVSGEAFYARLRELGNQYGPRFQGVAKISRRDGEALGEIRVPELLRDEVPAFAFHPAVLDACGQVLLAADREGGGFMPVVIDRIRVFNRPGERLFSHVEIRGAAGGDELVGDVRVYGEDGRLVAEMLGSHLQYLDKIGARAKASLDDSIYEIAWRSQADPFDDAGSRELAAGAWVILADRGGVGEGLAARLRQGGRRCVLIQKGERFAEIGRDRFTMSEGGRDDLRRVFERLGADGGSGIAGAVHLFSLDAPASQSAGSPGDIASIQRGGCASYLMLLQEAARLRRPPRVWAITRGAQAARPGEALPGLFSAPLWGLGRTAALELPSVWGGLIDIDPAGSDADAAEALAGELERPGREDQLAFRGGERLAARLVRRAAQKERPLTFRPDASYLVTGGLGSLGLKVARWMAEQGARRLILMGRTPLPPRSQWREAPPGSRLLEQITEIRAIEALGVSVVTAAVDVSDEAALRGFIDQYDREGWPSIRGVVHAAGVAGLCPLVELSASTLDADFRGKAAGAWLLDRLLGDVDFCVYYSSLSAILASPLLGGYAAANSFLDALAHDRRARGKRALSLNWGFWAEGGMASRHTAEQGRRAMPRGMDEFSPEQALAAQARLLREDASQAMIGVVDWPEYGASYPAAAALPLFDDLLRAVPRPVSQPANEVESPNADNAKPPMSGGRPRLSRDSLLAELPEVRTQRIIEFLGAEVARVLRIPVWKMETHVPLSNLGIDSMMATELKNGIEASIGVVLPLVRFLKGPTVIDLAGEIVSSLPADPAPLAGDLLPAARPQSLGVLPPPLAAAPAPPSAGPQDSFNDLAQAEELLRRIDHLSDDEVSALLEQMLEGGAECA